LKGGELNNAIYPDLKGKFALTTLGEIIQDSGWWYNSDASRAKGCPE
jgi:hypothetical protein